MPDAPNLWEANADWWQREFTSGADAEYEEQIIPLALELLAGRQRIVDVGTGEGQIARRLTDTGSTVVGFDPTFNQIRMASELGGASFGIADAAALPVASASCDAALACLVFEHIVAMPEAIAEITRTLVPGGRFVFMLNHPLLQTPDAGWIDDHMVDPPEQYWRLGPYLQEAHLVEEVQKDVFIPFIHRPLSRYINAIADNGLRLVRMIEPSPPEGFLSRSAAFRAAADIPRLLVLVAEKPA